ncbi:MAG TPA: hypothetical protein PLB76_00995 [Anaerohalosphaeraceae bacterium]|nr:hypothetical protein [Anaerohalosphaeraceae bacterium]
MEEVNAKIIARDDKLLKNEKSWRRARIGAIILAGIWLFIVYIFFKSMILEKEVLIFSIGWLLFWIVLIDWLNLRIWHIESIKYYRSKR